MCISAGITEIIDESLGEYVAMGGPGSGHWGHKGRKGKRGGSAPRGATTGINPGNFRSAIQQYGINAKFNKSNVYKKDGGAYTLRDKDGKNWGYIVKNRETGRWELKVDRWDYEEGKRQEIAKFTEDLGLHASPHSALNELNLAYGLKEKTTRVTRFQREKFIQSGIVTTGWNEKNYRKKFQEITGHKLDKSVTLAESKQIAQAMEGMPQAKKAATFHTHTRASTFDEACGGIERARAFYSWNNDIHFGFNCTRDITSAIGGRRIDAKRTIRHEYAHHIDYTFRSGKYNARSGLSKGKKIFNRAKTSDRFMTVHSRKNPQEFFATAFADIAVRPKRGDLGIFKRLYPEAYEMVEFVLGDKMPEEWK